MKNQQKSARTRVVVAEDEELLAGVLPDLLHKTSHGRIEVVQTCSTHFQLISTLRNTNPEVVLCDIWMPNKNGGIPKPCNALLLERIRRQSPNTAIMLLSGHADATLVKELLDSGANGFIEKNVAPRQIYQAINQIRQGKRYITPRFQDAIKLLNTDVNKSIRDELLQGRRGDVLRLLLEGFSSYEIAESLSVGKKYVDKKIAEIKRILNVRTHIRIFRACTKLGITKV